MSTSPTPLVQLYLDRMSMAEKRRLLGALEALKMTELVEIVRGDLPPNLTPIFEPEFKQEFLCEFPVAPKIEDIAFEFSDRKHLETSTGRKSNHHWKKKAHERRFF